MRDIELRERFNQLIDELNIYLSDKSVESYLERLKFAQDELEEITVDSKPDSSSVTKKRRTRKTSKSRRKRGEMRAKMYCAICKETVDVDDAYIGNAGLIEVLLSCGHKQSLKLQKSSGRLGVAYLVVWDLPAKSYSLHKTFYRALKKLCRDAGDHNRDAGNVFRTSDRELAFKVYALASEYGRANLYEAKLLKTSESE